MSIWDGKSDDLGARYERVKRGALASRLDHNPTLRDQFAMAALTGYLAAPDSEGSAAHFANSAYQLADAMLAAREAG